MSIYSLSSIVNFFASLKTAIGLLLLATVWGFFHGFTKESTINPWVMGLLILGFLANLILSALKRWPFHRSHLPFLLAHLGLVCVLVGFGTQYFFGREKSVFLTRGEKLELGDKRYTLSLKEARQTFYPNSTIPASYSCDLIFKTPSRTFEERVTLHNSFKTSEGLRFYLSGISPPDAAKITVKWVPMTFSLLYVGCFFVGVGILTLYIEKMRR